MRNALLCCYLVRSALAASTAPELWKSCCPLFVGGAAGRRRTCGPDIGAETATLNPSDSGRSAHGVQRR
ncbi:hypothetical protein PF003_g15941 [Phytophthora fragariae]|nr:hypothetical protein PF003_g15941 [Phytophthora fragariae]